MNQLATVHPQNQMITFNREQVDLIKSVVAKDATDDELKLFLYQAQRTGLDPLAKQLYFQKHRNNKTGKDQMTIITAIDGYRLIAARTGLHAGTDDPVFDDEDKPSKASVTVYKLVGGIRAPFTATARWNEYVPQHNFMWNKMPCLMLGKCAEALALRKAFPAELSGLYVAEEMHQAEDDPKPVGPQAVKTTPQDIKPKPEKKAPDTRSMLLAFSTFGVTQQQLEKALGKPMDQFDAADREQLGEAHRAIKAGEKKVGEVFPA